MQPPKCPSLVSAHEAEIRKNVVHSINFIRPIVLWARLALVGACVRAWLLHRITAHEPFT